MPLLEPRCIREDHHGLLRNGQDELVPPLGDEGPKGVRGDCDRRSQVGRRERELNMPAHNPRCVDEVLDKSAHLDDLTLDDRSGMLSGFLARSCLHDP
jgi:hypothetical protein